MEAPRSLAPMSVGAPMRLVARLARGPSCEATLAVRAQSGVRHTGKQILWIRHFGNEIDSLAPVGVLGIQFLQDNAAMRSR